jgi:ribonucleoside-diphosphate reductase alpha chain
MVVPELLEALNMAGLTPEQIEEATVYIRATKSCQGAPHVPPEISNVFVGANDISVQGHVMIQAALQCFVDGAISKTINAPHDFTKEDVKRTFFDAWRAGCKGICVYVSGSRQVEVLSAAAPVLAEPTDCAVVNAPPEKLK